MPLPARRPCSTRRRAPTLQRSRPDEAAHHAVHSLHEGLVMTPLRTPQPQQRTDTPPLRIAITGSTGLIGSALVPYLKGRGHTVSRLVRSTASKGAGDIHWDPARGILE